MRTMMHKQQQQQCPWSMSYANQIIDRQVGSVLARRRARSTCTRASAIENKQSSKISGESIRFRQGTAKDAPRIQQLIIAERMNPLGLQPSRFTLATHRGDEDDIVAIGQLAPLGDGEEGPVELRSLVVVPAWRNRGVGGLLLQELLTIAHPRQVYLTTIGRRTSFYKRAGFQQVPLNPASLPVTLEMLPLWFEVAAGTVVARIVAGDTLVVMTRK